MRTTIDLPDPLLKEAKSVAALRNQTLKDVVISALRRELQPHARASAPGGRLTTKNGLLVLKHKGRRLINPTKAQLDDFL